jgi:hypothetical protein
VAGAAAVEDAEGVGVESMTREQSRVSPLGLSTDIMVGRTHRSTALKTAGQRPDPSEPRAPPSVAWMKQNNALKGQTNLVCTFRACVWIGVGDRRRCLGRSTQMWRPDGAWNGVAASFPNRWPGLACDRALGPFAMPPANRPLFKQPKANGPSAGQRPSNKPAQGRALGC